MKSEVDIPGIAAYCKAALNLATAKLPDEYYYHSPPHCLVDAVFSIGVRYTSTRNTVHKFCDYYKLPIYSRQRLPESEQTSINQFIELINDSTPDELADTVFQNRQRTSARNGILKAQAVRLFAQVLKLYQVDYLQDVPKIISDLSFEKDIAEIPGQRSGLSTRYFYMLAGSDDYIKPDRMIRRFIYSAINQDLSMQKSHDAIFGAYELLVREYPNLTPRLLDYQIWNYQRDRNSVCQNKNSRIITI